MLKGVLRKLILDISICRNLIILINHDGSIYVERRGYTKNKKIKADEFCSLFFQENENYISYLFKNELYFLNFDKGTFEKSQIKINGMINLISFSKNIIGYINQNSGEVIFIESKDSKGFSFFKLNWIEKIKGLKLFRNFSDFSPLKVLNEGSFGEIQEIQEKDSLKFFAAKFQVIEKNPKSLLKLEKEILIHHLLSESEHVLPLKGISFVEFKQKSYIVHYLMKKCDSSLSDTIEKGGVTKAQKIGFIGDIISGIVDIHSKGVAHRDIKPDNIIIDNKRAKIIDFSISNLTQEDKSGVFLVGTIDYLPSKEVLGIEGEILDCVGKEIKSLKDSRKLDLYAVGVIISIFGLRNSKI